MRRVEHAVKAIEKDITGKKILEAACGCAEFSICAAAEAAAVVCIDLDDGRLLPETAACGNLTFARMDAASMEYEENSFDTAVMYNAAGHLEDVLPETVRECRRVVRKGGCVYIISSNMLDRQVIHNKLIPFLECGGIPHSFSSDKIFVYVRITV